MRILALETEVAGADAAAFRRLARDEAVLALECASLEEAAAALDGLPFVRAGLIRFELVPLRPYPGFARLFEPGEPGLPGAGVSPGSRPSRG